MYLKNRFEFSGGMSQRLLGALAATLFPLMLGLSLHRSHDAKKASTSSTIFQLAFIAKPWPSESVNNSANMVTKKAPIRHRAKNLSVKAAFSRDPESPASVNASVSASVSALDASTQIAETALTTITSHASESTADTWAKKIKGKSAISAFQDARSDIQKMADRKTIALQAERANKYEVFQSAANNAVIPDCLARGTTTKLGLDSFKGLLAIPVLATAAAMGKCK